MIEELLPGDVACAHAYDDPVEAHLVPAEEAALGNAVEKRRREFTTGRHCARLALAELGIGPVPLLPGPNREPCWPAGVVGSITHCAGYRAAVVARSAAFSTVGIDAEPNEPLPAGVLETIAVPAEREWVARRLDSQPHVRWDRLLFSLKESVYKAWFPLARGWLGFEEAVATIGPDGACPDPVAGTFDVRLMVAGPRLADGATLTGFTGRWLVRRGILLAAIAVPVVPAARPQGRGPQKADASDLING